MCESKEPIPVKIDYDDPQFRVSPFQQALASCSGALLTSLIMTPLDVVKIRMQTQQKVATHCFLYCNGLMDHLCSCQPMDPNNPWYKKSYQFHGTLDAFMKIGRHEGITSLWSGLSPTLVLSVPATICYFVTYEQLRLKLKSIYNKNVTKEKQTQPFWIPLISGGTARVISVTLVNPLELIRTKMQSQKLSYLEVGEALKFLIQTDGIKGLWKGITPTLLRDVPFSAIYWMSYEMIKSFWKTDGTPSFWQSFFSGAISGSLAATITVPFDVVKTHQQIEFGAALFKEDGQKVKSRTTTMIFRDIYRQQGIRGLYAGLTPRLIKVAPACAIMISSFEYGKVFFNRNNPKLATSVISSTSVYNLDTIPREIPLVSKSFN